MRGVIYSTQDSHNCAKTVNEHAMQRYDTPKKGSQRVDFTTRTVNSESSEVHQGEETLVGFKSRNAGKGVVAELGDPCQVQRRES